MTSGDQNKIYLYAKQIVNFLYWYYELIIADNNKSYRVY